VGGLALSIRILVASLGVLAAPAAGAQPITVADLDCLPLDGNAVVEARVAPRTDVPGGTVRLYFRRLNPVGAFYYVALFPTGGGAYRGVLPQPESHPQEPLTDEWWEVLRTRDWMRGGDRDRPWLERWLAAQAEEAAEVYAAVYDRRDELVERSAVRLVPVGRDDRCPARLDPRERGWAENLTVGETTALQAGRQPFHWRCDGVVVRISPDGVLRSDEFCRACLIGERRRGDDHDRLAAADRPPPA
jgi:hypothetical protein